MLCVNWQSRPISDSLELSEECARTCFDLVVDQQQSDNLETTINLIRLRVTLK
jgi:hypothetical protein